jgi:autonomous glycyl radical cofactor GrcA
MTCFDSENYKNLKRAAKTAGDVFAYASESLDVPYNGIAVAFQPTIANTNGKMLNVAVSYCSIEDKYKAKHGKYQALTKLVNGMYIQLPLASMLREHGPDLVGEYLLQTFEV